MLWCYKQQHNQNGRWADGRWEFQLAPRTGLVTEIDKEPATTGLDHGGARVRGGRRWIGRNRTRMGMRERERGERDGWFSICEAEKGADGSTRRASLAAYQFSALLFSFRNGRQRSTKGEESAFFFSFWLGQSTTLSIFSMSLLLTSEKEDLAIVVF